MERSQSQDVRLRGSVGYTLNWFRAYPEGSTTKISEAPKANRTLKGLRGFRV